MSRIFATALQLGDSPRDHDSEYCGNFAPAYSAWAAMLGAFVLLPVVSRRGWMRRLVQIGGVFVILLVVSRVSRLRRRLEFRRRRWRWHKRYSAGHYTLTVTAYTVSGDTSTASVMLEVR